VRWLGLPASVTRWLNKADRGAEASNSATWWLAGRQSCLAEALGDGAR
jgi:hypothetical protein